jgi:hypothetical protein
MKTLISIPLIILILFTGISVKFATHFCGGYVAATKVSLTGELATCGMESNSFNNTQQEIFSKHCCDDITSAYSICNNYFASSYNFDDPGQQVVDMITVPSDYLSNQKTIIITSDSDFRPPGTNHPNSVDRPVLCIFRI